MEQGYFNHSVQGTGANISNFLDIFGITSLISIYTGDNFITKEKYHSGDDFEAGLNVTLSFVSFGVLGKGLSKAPKVLPEIAKFLTGEMATYYVVEGVSDFLESKNMDPTTTLFLSVLSALATGKVTGNAMDMVSTNSLSGLFASGSDLIKGASIESLAQFRNLHVYYESIKINIVNYVSSEKGEIAWTTLTTASAIYEAGIRDVQGLKNVGIDTIDELAAFGILTKEELSLFGIDTREELITLGITDESIIKMLGF